MNQRPGPMRLTRSVFVALAGLGAAGCFLMPGSPRPDAKTVSGPVPYVENCTACHVEPTTAHYAESRHAARGVRCGQCHTPGGHPDFTEPVRDGKCGGCHQAEFQQTLASRHFAGRLQASLDADRAARASLRHAGFTAPTATGRRFVGDSSSGELGGRLCAGCHYDEHRLGLGPVKQASFCIGCHAGLDEHFADPTADEQNRCFTCHVRVGTTVAGQAVNTHLFARPGAAGAER
jgi:hypothetical protein